MGPEPTAEGENQLAQFMAVLTEAHGACQRGEVDLAEQTGERALAIALAMGEPGYEAIALGTLIGIYGLTGQGFRAIETGLRALALAAAIPDVNLCTTIHGDIVRVAAPEINKLNRQFMELATTGQFAEALRVGAEMRQIIVRLGDPMRLASVLATEGQLCARQGNEIESLTFLERAFDAAIPGGVYDLLPGLIGFLNDSLKEIVARALAGAAGPDSSLTVSRLGTRARTAEAILKTGCSEKIALVRSRYSASDPTKSLQPLDSLLGELSGSADSAGLATATALKASLVAAREFITNGRSQEVLGLYDDALTHAVASRNARVVWQIAADAAKAIEDAREAGLAEEAPLVARAEDKLRSSLQEFAAVLSQ